MYFSPRRNCLVILNIYSLNNFDVNRTIFVYLRFVEYTHITIYNTYSTFNKNIIKAIK